jgi:hypothetical protein
MRTTIFYLIWMNGRKSKKSAGICNMISKYILGSQNSNHEFLRQFEVYCKIERDLNAGT